MPVEATVIDPSPLAILPFAGLLLAIALLPIVLKHHRERHYHKISIRLDKIPVCYYLFGLKAGGEMADVAGDYLSFMAVSGLFSVS